MSLSLQNTTNDDALLAEIGQRIQRQRLSLEWTQAELADHAGVSRSTVERLERGNSVTLSGFMRILRALELLPGFDQALPRPGPSPMEMLRNEGVPRRRAPRRKDPSSTAWTWDDP
ncbi:MAG: XRE family transcriptional regulator [Deltaproteobacteria bacterium]|nr:MAG: XRE family transcriptional regulator [Deltaproteobacteria bacterium]